MLNSSRRDEAANRGISRNTTTYHLRPEEARQPPPVEVFGGARYDEPSTENQRGFFGLASKRHTVVVRPPPFAGHHPVSEDSFYRRHSEDSHSLKASEARRETSRAYMSQRMRPHQPSPVGTDILSWKKPKDEPTGRGSLEKLCEAIATQGARVAVALCRQFHEKVGGTEKGLDFGTFEATLLSVKVALDADFSCGEGNIAGGDRTRPALNQAEIRALFHRFGGARPGNQSLVCASECVEGVLLNDLKPSGPGVVGGCGSGRDDSRLGVAKEVFKQALQRAQRRVNSCDGDGPRVALDSVALSDLLAGGSLNVGDYQTQEDEDLSSAAAAIREEAHEAFRKKTTGSSSCEQEINRQEFLVFSSSCAKSLDTVRTPLSSSPLSDSSKAAGRQGRCANEGGLFVRALRVAFGVNNASAAVLDSFNSHPAGKENVSAGVVNTREGTASVRGGCVHHHLPGGGSFTLNRHVVVPPTPFELALAQQTTGALGASAAAEVTPGHHHPHHQSVSASTGGVGGAAGMPSQPSREASFPPPPPPRIVPETNTNIGGTSGSFASLPLMGPLKVIEGRSGPALDRDMRLAAAVEDSRRQEERRYQAYLENRSRPWIGQRPPASSPGAAPSPPPPLPPPPPPPPPFNSSVNSSFFTSVNSSGAAVRQAHPHGGAWQTEEDKAIPLKSSLPLAARRSTSSEGRGIDELLDSEETLATLAKQQAVREWGQAVAKQASDKRASAALERVARLREERELLFIGGGGDGGGGGDDAAAAAAAAAGKHSPPPQGSTGSVVDTAQVGLSSLRHFPSSDRLSAQRTDASRGWVSCAHSVWDAQAKAREEAPLSITRKPEFGGVGYRHQSAASTAPSSSSSSSSSAAAIEAGGGAGGVGVGHGGSGLGEFGSGEQAAGGGEYSWARGMAEAQQLAEHKRRQGNSEALQEYERAKFARERQAAKDSEEAGGRPFVQHRRFHDSAHGRRLLRLADEYASSASASAAGGCGSGGANGGVSSDSGPSAEGAPPNEEEEGVVGDGGHDYAVSVYNLDLRDVRAIAIGKGRPDLLEHLERPDKINDARLARLLQWETHRPGDELRTIFGVSTKRQAIFLAQLLTLVEDSCSGDVWTDAVMVAHNSRPGCNPVEKFALIERRRAQEAEEEEKRQPQQQQQRQRGPSLWHAMGMGQQSEFHTQEQHARSSSHVISQAAGVTSSAPVARWNLRGAKDHPAQASEWDV